MFSCQLYNGTDKQWNGTDKMSKSCPSMLFFIVYLKYIFIDRQINSNEGCRENNCTAKLFVLI